jgi:nucleoside-diphosphate-sugar epimerase
VLHPPLPGTVLVTGAAGYVGATVVGRLLEAGRPVRAVDALLFGDDAHRRPTVATAGGPLEFITADIRDRCALRAAATGCDAIVHLARLVGDPACAIDPKLTRAINVDGTATVAAVAVDAGIRRVVFASTCSVYGAAGDDWLDEDSATTPVSLYAETHLEAEAIIRAHLAGTATDAVILRFATIFGLARRMRFDLVVNLLTARAMREGAIEVHGGEQWRPQVHVEDVARAVQLAVDHPNAAGGVFNVGSDALNLRIAELGSRISGRFPGAGLKVSPSRDLRSYRVSFDRIQDVLGFHAERSLESGIDEIAAWLAAHPGLDHRAPRFSNVLALQAMLHA